jgi:hypothetical protein
VTICELAAAEKIIPSYVSKAGLSPNPVPSHSSASAWQGWDWLDVERKPETDKQYREAPYRAGLP